MLSFQHTTAFIIKSFSTVLGLALLLLILWQSYRHRDNQLMALYLASLILSTGTNAWMDVQLFLGQSAIEPYLYTVALGLALNGLALFALAGQYAGLWRNRWVRTALLFGALFVVGMLPFLYQGRLFKYISNAEDLFAYSYEPTLLGYLNFTVIYAYYIAALVLLWVHRKQRAGALLIGGLITVGGILTVVVPILQDYPLDNLAWAVGSVIFARAILKERLFDPLVELNASLKATNAHLLELKDAAEAANRAKSTFLANMSHELRTPLNIIIGYSEMIEEEAHELGMEVIIPDLQRINSAGRHLLMLVNDILDLSKIEAGKMQLYVEYFDLLSLVEDTAHAIRPLAEKNHNTLTLVCPSQSSEMYTDPMKVRQCLYNLLSNASKFTENGQITLEVERQAHNGRDWVTFRVSDTGIGMTPEQIARLYQPFVQGDSSATRKFGGTGLGLAITHHFCQLMGGHIEVESQLGQGSTFTIRLPAVLESPSLGEGQRQPGKV